MSKEGGPLARGWEAVNTRTARPGQDPAFIEDGDGFLLVQSRNNREIALVEVNDLENIASRNNKEKIIWKPGRRGVFRHGVWAPEILTFPHTPWGGHNWMYFSATPDRNAGHRRIVGKSVGPDPRGPYDIETVLIDRDHDNWAIDMTVVTPDPLKPTEIFAVWSEDEHPGEEGSNQKIYMQPMSDPATLTGRRMLLAEPVNKWEAHINEGPQALHYQDDTFVGIHYAGGPSWTNRYGVGVILWTGGDPMTQSSWEKLPDPLYVGGGHAAIGLRQNGKNYWARGEKLATEPVLDDGWDDRGILVGQHDWDHITRLPILQQTPIDLVTFTEKDHVEYAGDLAHAAGF